MSRKYLDLCNEVINIMSYLPVTSMEGLNTPEGRLIKQSMNNVLKELCCGEHDTWKFRERIKKFYLSEGKRDYPLPDGYITYIRPDDDTNRPPLIYTQESRYLPLSSNGTPVYYWISDDKIKLFPIPGKNEEGDCYKIHYLTDKFVIDNNGCLKDNLELADDEPIVPEMYRSLLVYGVIRDFRSSSGDAKSDFYRKKYNSLYNKMLSNQRMTEDYFRGGKMLPDRPSTLEAKIAAFKNPYSGSGK